jgi:hypothetical protein
VVTVAVQTEDGHRVSARVPLRPARSDSSDARRFSAAQSLGCVRGPREQRCRGSVADSGMQISVDRAVGGAPCATARSVLRQVATWASSRCFADLCAKHDRSNRGFRCAVAKVGEADWTITCRRGKQSIEGSTAD